MLYNEVESTLISNFLTVPAVGDGEGSGANLPYVPYWDRMGWRTDGVDSGLNQRALLRHLQYDTDGAIDCAYEYCLFVERSGGDVQLINMLCKWFTTEDLIFYGIRYDSDESYLLSYWNPVQEKRFKSKPGKFYRQWFGRTDRHAQWFAEEWDRCVQESRSTHERYCVTVHTAPVDIVHEYRAMHNGLAESCCTHRSAHFNTGGVHPCMVYGGESGVHLAVIREKEDRSVILGRTLIYQGKYVRIYPTNDRKGRSVIENVLRLEGVATGPTSLNGARLNFVQHPDDDNLVICPYIDDEDGRATKVYVEKVKGKKFLIVSTEGFDTHLSDFYSSASFDQYGNYNSYDHECDRCGDGFHSDDSDSIFVDNGSYCGSSCAEHAGYHYSRLCGGNEGWAHDDEVVYYNGDYYEADALEDWDLIMCETGEVHAIVQCYQIEGRGWYPMSDVKICHSMSDFRRGSEQKRITVWCPEGMTLGTPMTAEQWLDYGYELFELSDPAQFRTFSNQCNDELLSMVENTLSNRRQTPF